MLLSSLPCGTVTTTFCPLIWIPGALAEFLSTPGPGVGLAVGVIVGDTEPVGVGVGVGVVVMRGVGVGVGVDVMLGVGIGPRAFPIRLTMRLVTPRWPLASLEEIMICAVTRPSLIGVNVTINDRAAALPGSKLYGPAGREIEKDEAPVPMIVPTVTISALLPRPVFSMVKVRDSEAGRRNRQTSEDGGGTRLGLDGLRSRARPESKNSGN